MKKFSLLMIALGCFSSQITLAATPAVTELMSEYATQSANSPDAQRGQTLWTKKFKGDARFPERSCASCHTANLKQKGKHVKTQKTIEPMAPSVGSKRLTSTREIKKWFKRNCKWTLGRECTAAEKADLLTYIQQQ